LPVAVGFGVRDPRRAASVARVADAVVVGSALVDRIDEAIAHKRDPVSNLLATAAELAQAVRSARADPS
ncbi:MAG: tryptophan synthase subunit alpha, partial [Caulobacteraceae bacterium]